LKTLYVPSPRKLENYRDSEYRVSYQLLKLSEYSPELKMIRSDNLAFDFRFYSRLALSLAKRRLKLPIPRKWTLVLSQNYWMPTGGAESEGADAILAYQRYPINARLPVIWITGSTDVVALRRRPMAERDIQREIEFKREANARAALTILPTYAMKRLFDDVINPSKPTYVIPWFQPIQPIARDRFLKKWCNLTQIKLLFVGRAAVGKGLQLVLDAYTILQNRYPGRVSLHVVTTFQDGPVEVPSLPGLVQESLIPHFRVIELMTESHYLLMPSVLEQYGLVYIEAMARGTIPLASDSPVQRELLDEGRAGLLVERNAHAVADAIAPGLEDQNSVRELARRVMSFWKSRHAPEVIAPQFASLANTALNHVARAVM
jgi:glycosyltransferase involved in cell wall biosynthesis